MSELQAGIEQSLTLLQWSPVLLQPGKAALGNPVFAHHLEGVKPAFFGNLHRHVPQNFLHALREGLPRITTITQLTLRPVQGRFATFERHQYTLAIDDIGGSYRNDMRQSLGARRNMAFDAGNFLACIIALQLCRIRVSSRPAHPRSRMRCDPISHRSRQPDFFKACSGRLPSSCAISESH